MMGPVCERSGERARRGLKARSRSERAPSSAPSARSKYRWLVCALLFLATTINYIDRQILSLLKPILDTELGWTTRNSAR